MRMSNIYQTVKGIYTLIYPIFQKALPFFIRVLKVVAFRNYILKCVTRLAFVPQAIILSLR